MRAALVAAPIAIGVALSGAACASPGSYARGPALTPALGAAEEREVAAVLDDFHDAAAAGDFDRYFSHFAENAVFLGTNATERWTVAEFREYARPYLGPGGGWTYRPRARHVSVTSDGRTAFFDELLDNDALGETRGSGVLVREDGAWRVAQYNLSIPIPNEVAGRVIELIRAPR